MNNCDFGGIVDKGIPLPKSDKLDWSEGGGFKSNGKNLGCWFGWVIGKFKGFIGIDWKGEVMTGGGGGGNGDWFNNFGIIGGFKIGEFKLKGGLWFKSKPKTVLELGWESNEEGAKVEFKGEDDWKLLLWLRLFCEAKSNLEPLRSKGKLSLEDWWVKDLGEELSKGWGPGAT